MSPLSRIVCLMIPMLLTAFASLHAAEGPAKKIVLIAGAITGHPKEAHEYEKNVILLKHLLETSPDLQGKVRVEAHFKGWPADPSTLDDADTIFITSDGTDRDEKNHPFYVGDHLEVIEKQMRRGCGLVLFHWSTFNPMRVHDRITEWVGGHFDYETGSTPNHWYSAIQTWNAESRPRTPDHPILRGVNPFSTQEEYYYRIKFRDSDPRLKPIILTRPPNETNDFAVGWAVERSDGGRGFGFTGGHFYKNWWNPNFRRLILNAIVWSAKLDVPRSGVRSESFDRFKALILTGHNHPAHDWRATTAALIPALEQDPRTIVQVAENIEDLATEKINEYALLVMNYCNWDLPGLSEAAKSNFIRYLQNGGGLAVIHFANGAFTDTLPNKDCDWPEYRTRIVRRIWDHRPGLSGHDSYGPFHVEIAAAKNPIIDGLQPFNTMDELYFRQQGELPIEPLAFALSKQTGHREPMAWAYDYGKGRVFQTVLGHSDESIRKAAMLIRRGCVWAAGRNEISFDPPAGLTEGSLFRDGSPWTPQESLKRAGAAAPTAGNVSPTVAAKPASVADAKPVRSTPSQGVGTPAVSGVEPGTQGEKDWVDNRWSRTDVGPFLASSLKLPNGMVTKALTIRVGDRDEASVCFDTANLNLRAGWTGGFLKFDAARFGLLNAPKIDGEVQFVAPEGPGWIGSTGRFSGFHVHDKRVVLEYKLGDTTVRESPWYQLHENKSNGGIQLQFERVLKLDSTIRPLRLALVSLTNGTKVDIHADPDGERTFARWRQRSNRALPTLTKNSLSPSVVSDSCVIGVEGKGIGLETNDDGVLVVSFPASNQPQQARIYIWCGGPFEGFYTMGPKPRDSDVDELLAPTNGRWLPALETVGQVAPDTGPLSIDTLTVPYDNPWNALMFLSGVDFTRDGTAYVCSIHGDVWKVTGIDGKLDKLTWHRFATGLYQPLGLKVVNDQIYVLGRDQITRLRDQNGDGEADFYENFCNLIETFPESHHYVTSLETDARGNFYYVDPVGAHQVSPDGRVMKTLATGFRNPNGMGVSPDGSIITVAPQQGEWTPSSLIVEIKPGGYYGYGGPKVTPDRPLGYDPVLCWIPHSVDNSSGSEVWVPGNHWGALGGQMLHFSWGRCMMMLVLRDVVDGMAQGATVQLPGRFLSGAMRGAYHPQDGHLYVVGSTGWQTSAIKDGSFQRVRFTGKPLAVPVAWKARANGIEFTFAETLEKETAEDPGSYDVQQWNYRYAADYGSNDWSVTNPSKEGHDRLDVKSARLAADGKSVFLEIPGLKQVMQLQVQYNLNNAKGDPMRNKIYATINRLGNSR